MTGTSRFDEAARSWDTPPRVEIARAAYAAIRERVHLRPGMRALDFGAGTGLLSLAFCDEVAAVTALDTSAGMLKVLEEKLAELGVANVDTRRMDLTAGETTDRKYDLIVSSMALHHVGDIDGLLEAFHRLLAPGGSIALADLDREDGTFHSDNTGVEHFGFDRVELLGRAGRAGFSGAAWDIIHTVRREREGVLRGYDIFLLTGFKA